MIENKRVLAWIPARGGSKGIIKKNIYPLEGKPLIAYTIEAAQRSKYIDTVMVSTDSEEIAEISRQYGAWVPSLRPACLASDTSKTLDAVIYSLELLKELGDRSDIFCLLQPTSPLRDEADIDGALELFNEKQQGVVAVSEVKENPLLIRTVSQNGEAEPLLKTMSTCRRQDMPKYYRVNGSIYVNACAEITGETSFNDNPIAYIMENCHSVDIDEMVDLVVAAYNMEHDVNKV